jgi:hypothetical protein
MSRVSGELKTATGHFNQFVTTQVPALNGVLQSLKLKTITINALR